MQNRFKRLDLIDREPDEQWAEVHDSVQETSIKRVLMENRCKKAKWRSKEALQIVVKRRDTKSKAERERYKYVNKEFQTKERRDKKAFLSDQCKEIDKRSKNGKVQKSLQVN